jgi:putative NADPH-quinone reductase
MNPIRQAPLSDTESQDACSTLLLSFHPDPLSSRTNAALAAAADRIPGVSVREIARLYPSGDVDVDAEVAHLLAADRLVMLFPVQWYMPPATFKTWADLVLTRMYFEAYATEGRRMEGKPLLVAATTGAAPDAYGPDGRSLYPLEMLLRPLEAMAYRCGLRWTRPFLLYRAGRLSGGELEQAGDAFATRLRSWALEREAQRRAAAGCAATPSDLGAYRAPLRWT